MWNASYCSRAHKTTLGDQCYRHLRCPETPAILDRCCTTCCAELQSPTSLQTLGLPAVNYSPLLAIRFNRDLSASLLKLSTCCPA